MWKLTCNTYRWEEWWPIFQSCQDTHCSSWLWHWWSSPAFCYLPSSTWVVPTSWSLSLLTLLWGKSEYEKWRDSRTKKKERQMENVAMGHEKVTYWKNLHKVTENTWIRHKHVYKSSQFFKRDIDLKKRNLTMYCSLEILWCISLSPSLSIHLPVCHCLLAYLTTSYLCQPFP